MRIKPIILLLACSITSLLSFAQDKSNRGKEFWLGYGFHWFFTNPDAPIPANAQELALYISTEQAATVTVSINGTSWSQTLNIPANTVDASILVPKTGANDARILTDGLSARGIHIVSNVPVAVYAHVYVTQGSGATMLMPVETYGYSYYSVNYSQATSGSPLPNISPVTQNGPDWYSWFYVVASENNTRVEIVPSDSTKGGWLPGQTYTVNLNKGEIYTVFGKMVPNNNQAWAASKDMTGSKIKSVVGADGSCHPIAVFSGSSGIRICRGDGGEYMQQQVFPTQAWGTRYLTYHTINNTSTDILETNRNYYRICVSDPSAVVKRNGVVLTGLINNFYYELQDSTGGDYIESDKPILVSQYTVNENQCWNFPTTSPSPPSNGDPEMFYLSPIEQGQKSVRFFASRQSPAVAYIYTNIILPTTGVPSLRVDGAVLPASQIIPHPNLPSYSVALARFVGPAAQHTIVSDSTFNATVYGLGNYESYGYNVGTNINNLNHYDSIRNVYNTSGQRDTSTCPKSPVHLFVRLGYPATSIHWKLSQVPGMSPNADSIINNPTPVGIEIINGRTYYVYTLRQDFIFTATGTYIIPVSFTANVIENCSQTEYAEIKVVVKPGPTADFTFPSPACLSDSIHFTGTPTANGHTLVNYNWSFDDNTTANTINAVKLFTTGGNQNVRYTVYADNGCVGDTTKTVSILEGPVAAFSINGNICQGDSVRITDASTISSGTITSWQWNFGDGNSETRTNNNPFYHRYATPGNYTISLIAISGNGCKSDTAFVPVSILPKPIASFGYDKNICVGDSILITDNSTFATGTITNWQWNFGDGKSLNATNNSPFYHPYTAGGNYPLSLVVTGNNGCASDTFRLTVNVSSQPTATFTITGKACEDSVLSFSSSVLPNSSNPPTWNWNFGDGIVLNTTTSNLATHTYANVYTNLVVKHWVSYSAGCASDTSYNTIPAIHANPVASFVVTGDPVCEGKAVTISSSATGINNWQWTLGNTNSSAVPSFDHVFNSTGNQIITLKVKTNAGCGSMPASQTITVYPAPLINAGTDQFIKLGMSATLDASISNPANYDFVWTPAVFLNDATILNPVSTPDITTTYTIRATDKVSGCFAEDKTVVTPVSNIYIPSAFTPNGDGKNDRWEIPGLALYPDARVTIFNRWGQKIFEAKDYINHPWNGLYKNIMQPHDAYVYVIQLNDEKKQLFKGTVILIQ